MHHPGPGPQTSQVVVPAIEGPRRKGARRDDRPLENPDRRLELRYVRVAEAAEQRVVVAVAGLVRVDGPLRGPPGGQRGQPPEGVVGVCPTRRIFGQPVEVDTGLAPHRQQRPAVVAPQDPGADNPGPAALREESLEPSPLAPDDKVLLCGGPGRKLDERVPPEEAQHPRRVGRQPVTGAELVPDGSPVREGEVRQVRRHVPRPWIPARRPRDGRVALGDLASHGGGGGGDSGRARRQEQKAEGQAYDRSRRQASS